MQAIYHHVYRGMFGHVCRDTMFAKPNGTYILRKTSTDPDVPTKDIRVNEIGLEGWLEGYPDQIIAHGPKAIRSTKRKSRAIRAV